jgi:hypothetical protein
VLTALLIGSSTGSLGVIFQGFREYDAYRVTSSSQLIVPERNNFLTTSYRVHSRAGQNVLSYNQLFDANNNCYSHVRDYTAS